MNERWKNISWPRLEMRSYRGLKVLPYVTHDVVPDTWLVSHERTSEDLLVIHGSLERVLELATIGTEGANWMGLGREQFDVLKSLEKRFPEEVERLPGGCPLPPDYQAVPAFGYAR